MPTDHEQFESIPWPSRYVWIAYGAAPTGDEKFSYANASHFRVYRESGKVWVHCTHGAWDGELKFDESGKLVKIRIPGRGSPSCSGWTWYNAPKSSKADQYEMEEK